jgi:ABC-2 type transport system ATP-binding protein
VSIQESVGKESAYRGRGAPPGRAEVEAALTGIDGVKKMDEIPTDERAHAYELTSEQDSDLRPDIFKLIVDKGWVLLELHRDTQTLEDVFRSLTIGDERRNRNVDARPSDQEEDEEEEDEDDDEDDDEDEEENDGKKTADASKKDKKSA